MKKVVKDVLRYFNELTSGLSDGEYMELLEELVFELEDKHNKLSFDEWEEV